MAIALASLGTLQAVLQRRIPAGAKPLAALHCDSRRVAAGEGFFALVGERFDGHDFIAQVLTRRPGALAVSDPATYATLAARNDLAGTALLLVRPGRESLAELAAAVYGHPSRALHLLGVTGTNGKSTVTYLVQQLCAALGRECGVIGSLGMGIGAERAPGERTTPEAPEIEAFLAQCVSRGVGTAAMEVSSIALAQRRTHGLHFHAGAFTNLTQDHLDFHGSMAQYGRDKARLFLEYPLDCAVLNLDDPVGIELFTALAAEHPRMRRLGFSCQGRPGAALAVERLQTSAGGSRGVLVVEGARCDFALPLAGHFNVSNMLAAVGLLMATGAEPVALAAALPGCTGAPGRFERVPVPGGFTAVVDYAHTPDALDNVLRAAREVATGRVLVLFGCGGERDVIKRPLMGAVAAELADVVLVTSDNPRGESPRAIIDAVLAGVPPARAGRVEAMEDRAAAIAHLLGRARPGDVVLLAGKGHEPYQEIGGKRLPFDDREQVRRWAAQQ
ncbi:MAG: UDP-N-acetylmuramoyl-L-alanyl-D-glutamate--2,6-diaminopimelate ligase [Candidatus Lambdaproteobacteria bacterium]|nr:UDP-N-acetylmuramoyl-L-alanyl-D-glutamate--2,6-diaminopimelate ligase [Candidatus Lambdaproteobacteria bacterium]